MKIYAICQDNPYDSDTLIRFYKTKEDAKWGMNKILAGEDEWWEWNYYNEYAIIEIEVEE